MDKYLYEETRLNLVRRARNFAVACLSCSLVLIPTPQITLGLGFFAILFAIISKGYRPKMDKEAVTAVKFAIAGIVIGCIALFAQTYKIMTDMDNGAEVITPTDNSAYVERFKELYGVDPSEILNQLTGGDTDE